MQTIRLTRGLGEKGKSHCVMAATSIVAGEKFTDRPKCVCPTITSALIYLNVSYGDDDVAREEALGHMPWLIIGTRGDRKHELERAFLFADWAVRECCGIECEPITDRETARVAANIAQATAYAADTARVSSYNDFDIATYAIQNARTNAANDAASAARSAARPIYVDDVARAASNAAHSYDIAHTNRRQDLIAYIESTIIPVYTTMKVEPGFRNECLILA